MKNFMLLALMMYSICAFADVNKWVDDKGRVHYSDEPPPSSAKKLISSTPKSRRSSDSSDLTESDKAQESGTPAEQVEPDEPKSIAEREAELKKKQIADQEKAAKAAKQQAIKEANQENCNQARLSLKTLQSDMRIMELDAKGEQTYLDDNQRQQRITKIQQDINKLCN